MQPKISAFLKPSTPKSHNPPKVTIQSEVKEPEIHITYKRRTPREDPKRSNEDDGTEDGEKPLDVPIRPSSSPSRILNKKRSYAQLHLELGQSDFLLHTCSICGLNYARGEEEDEKVHKKYHKDFTHGIPFKGWSNERLISACPSERARIILMLDDDPPAQKNKVQEVSKMMETELGFSEGWLIHKLCKVYLFVSTQRLIGCLVAEPIKTAYRVMPNLEVHKSSKKTNLKAAKPNYTKFQFGNINFQREVIKNEPSVNKLETLEDSSGVLCYEKVAVPAVCGIRAIWVTPSNRRKHVATKLLDAARKSFCMGNIVETSELAFSEPTSLGKVLASTYTATNSFLVYIPS